MIFPGAKERSTKRHDAGNRQASARSRTGPSGTDVVRRSHVIARTAPGFARRDSCQEQDCSSRLNNGSLAIVFLWLGVWFPLQPEIIVDPPDLLRILASVASAYRGVADAVLHSGCAVQSSRSGQQKGKWKMLFSRTIPDGQPPFASPLYRTNPNCTWLAVCSGTPV